MLKYQLNYLLVLINLSWVALKIWFWVLGHWTCWACWAGGESFQFSAGKTTWIGYTKFPAVGAAGINHS